METIFCKPVPLIVRTSDREERKSFVQLHIQLQSMKHDSKKELVVKLTDDEDLLFLYTLRLAENDFHSLKVQQALLVDFTAFPQKFVDLLEMCIRENSKENPKFVIHFVGGGNSIVREDAPYVLNIVETNPFRHLNHLSLKFLPGSDVDVKSHLASSLKQMKETNSLIQHKYEHTYKDLSSQLQETQERLASKTSELETLMLEWSSRMSDITSKHKEDMAVEKEKTIQFQSSLQVRFERERKDLEQAHSKQIKQLEGRLEDCEANNKELTDRNYKLESSVRDHKSRLTLLEEERTRVKSELNSLRKENASLDQSCQEKDKSINHLQTRVAVLEQELKDKVELLNKSNDLLGVEKDKKKLLDIDLDNKMKEISKLETKVKAMGDELKKGNEIIKKLQGDAKSYLAKVKLCRQIATEQEKLLSEKDSELEKLRQDLATTKDKLRETEDQNHKLKTNLETATHKLDESKNLLITNDKMIAYLNKQLNEVRITQSNLGMFEFPQSSVPQARPTAAVHNYSTTSYGSAVSHENVRSQAQQRATLGSHLHQPGLVPFSNQVIGNATLDGRRSAIPVLQSQVTSSTSPNTLNNSGGDKDKNPPLDPKFLMKKEEAVPVRGAFSYNSNNKHNSGLNLPSSAAASSSMSPQGNIPTPVVSIGHPASSVSVSKPTGNQLENGAVRLSQQMIIPKHPQPPLVSAYFPTQSS